MMQLSEEDTRIIRNLDQIDDLKLRKKVLMKVFFRNYGRYPDSGQELYNFYYIFGYDGEYMKINQKHVDARCFCSDGDCVNEFELGEVVVCNGGNLFHPKCFGDFKIKKPEFHGMKLACSECHEVFSNVDQELYALVWRDAKCPGCWQKALVEASKK